MKDTENKNIYHYYYLDENELSFYKEYVIIETIEDKLSREKREFREKRLSSLLDR